MTQTFTHTGWIIYPRYVARHGDNAFGWLADEAAAVGIDLHVLFAEELTVGYGHGTAPAFWHRGEAVTRLPDFAIVRTYDTVLSRALERAGVPLINSSASMELCKNKMLTHELLAAAGIPTPQTLYAPEGEYDYRHVAGVLGSERFVVKRIDGAKGEDVFLIDNEEGMRQAVAQCKGHCLCQQFIACIVIPNVNPSCMNLLRSHVLYFCQLFGSSSGYTYSPSLLYQANGCFISDSGSGADDDGTFVLHLFHVASYCMFVLTSYKKSSQAGVRMSLFCG